MGQTCCPHILPCSPILYMYVCAHVHLCMHMYTQSPDLGPPCCWQRVLCSDTNPGCDTPHCTAGLASLVPTEVRAVLWTILALVIWSHSPLPSPSKLCLHCSLQIQG